MKEKEERERNERSKHNRCLLPVPPPPLHTHAHPHLTLAPGMSAFQVWSKVQMGWQPIFRYEHIQQGLRRLKQNVLFFCHSFHTFKLHAFSVPRCLGFNSFFFFFGRSNLFVCTHPSLLAMASLFPLGKVESGDHYASHNAIILTECLEEKSTSVKGLDTHILLWSCVCPEALFLGLFLAVHTTGTADDWRLPPPPPTLCCC